MSEELIIIPEAGPLVVEGAPGSLSIVDSNIRVLLSENVSTQEADPIDPDFEETGLETTGTLSIQLQDENGTEGAGVSFTLPEANET